LLYFSKLSHTVTIDGDITCEHCVLRISRQAKEWSTEKDDYVFWSCADVTVVDESKGSLVCSCKPIKATCLIICWCLPITSSW